MERVYHDQLKAGEQFLLPWLLFWRELLSGASGNRAYCPDRRLGDGFGCLPCYEVDRDHNLLRFAFALGWVGLTFGALRMDARLRIGGLVAYRAKCPRRYRFGR
jgi:hypothetical protein